MSAKVMRGLGRRRFLSTPVMETYVVMPVKPVQWRARRLFIIDQTLLPRECVEMALPTVDAVWEAIKRLRVRGAPAIGICAAYGVMVGILERNPAGVAETLQAVRAAADRLSTSRPTAVNLFWALDRMRRVAETAAPGAANTETFIDRLEAEAMAIHAEDEAMCLAIGRHGAPLIHENAGVLTHCNAGGLATSGYGTALAPMFVAHEQGRKFSVFADETRPLLQGARLTAWELVKSGIDVTLICDNMAAQVMRERRINMVIVGADRIAANGDAANKIGTYGVAVLAKEHKIPFYVAAPSSTFDLTIETGGQIPIEERDPEEITHGFGLQTGADGVKVYNPAFDVTPAQLITGIITEKGIIESPNRENIARVLGT